MPEKERVRKSVYIDRELEDAINLRHATSRGFYFQTVAEELVKAWSDAGMHFPVDISALTTSTAPLSSEDADAALGRALREWVASFESERSRKIAAVVLEEVEEIARKSR